MEVSEPAVEDYVNEQQFIGWYVPQCMNVCCKLYFVCGVCVCVCMHACVCPCMCVHACVLPCDCVLHVAVFFSLILLHRAACTHAVTCHLFTPHGVISSSYLHVFVILVISYLC